jgi:dihydrofolate reductase
MRDAAVELVVAVAENDVIGRAGQLPWYLPADLKHFKTITMGHHILMGRKTYESIGKALPGRSNWVLSRSAGSGSSGFAADDAKLVRTIKEAQTAVGGELPLMVIGGAEVYRLCLPSARRIHLTLVHTEIKDGDTFFADWRLPKWVESSREHHQADAKNAYAYSFVTLDRA